MPKFDHMPCVLVQSDNWTATPARLRSFGGRSVGFPSQTSLSMSLLDYRDSSPRLELKMTVPKDASTPATYFGPKMETGPAASTFIIVIRLEAKAIRSLTWRKFVEAELELPADAKGKSNVWTVFEFAVHNPGVQGWPMPFKARFPEADACFQDGHRMEGLASTMAQLVGSNGIITVAMPTKPKKHPQPSDIETVLNKSPFAYFDYGPVGWDPQMNRYKATIAQHRNEAKDAPPYPPIVAYPTAFQAATALEQGVVQDIFDVHQHVLRIRNGQVPVRFVRQRPNSNDKYWAIAKFSSAFRAQFETSLGRLKRDGDAVGIAFTPPPSGGKSDDDVWPRKVIVQDVGFQHSGDLVLDCRRPGIHDAAKRATREKVIKAVNTWIEGEKKDI
ncbi:hypothetical protein EDB81DRAFT_888726 [Dactylonectria macrodidyma]|uniref:Uncharacterized protein n=1 Tax=Dactylonectria macrodidyma TaxID=307937 RepID=A0A9P9E2X8_9HYPO|nr:hypothetical protein EDB81DRAFT_888726 [Dactylonectria macrodidyma]